jgi:hypothetical protein
VWTLSCSNIVLMEKTYGVGQVKPCVSVDVGLSESASVNEPVELIVPVHVLSRTQSVRHALDAVHDRTREVVSGVNLKDS